MTKSTPEKLQAIAALVETVRRLRAPGGCPWDIAQTHQTLRPYLMEEATEVLDVLDKIDSPAALKDEVIRGHFREELGDLLMQVVLHAEMTSQEGVFDFYDVAETLNEKLIRRHPHVFGETKVDSVGDVLSNWEKIKAKEKEGKAAAASVLDGLPKGLPSLQKTAKVIEKVTKVGFQWADMQGPLAKVEEELAEMKSEVLALEAFKKTQGPKGDEAGVSALRKKLEGEIGDLLFSLSNVAYLMKINPEDALRSTLARFESRFRHVEKRLRENGKSPEQSTLEEMDRYWDEAKANERGSGRK